MYFTDAIVLGSRPTGEADELVSCYTRDFGKMIIKARSSKKITTKQGIFLHNPSIIRFNFVISRTGYIFSGIKSIKGHPAISDNITALAYVMSFLQLCDKITYEGQKDEEMWELLCKVLRDASSVAEKDSSREELWKAEKEWLISLLGILGLAPQNLNFERVKNARQLDIYIRRLLQNKLEYSVEFFGLKNHV
ncbi:MAG: DNA repair protein RecO [Candidatus Spechtbacterales bacterium]